MKFIAARRETMPTTVNDERAGQQHGLVPELNRFLFGILIALAGVTICCPWFFIFLGFVIWPPKMEWQPKPTYDWAALLKILQQLFEAMNIGLNFWERFVSAVLQLQG
jgi:hypothetical protein